MATRKLLDKEEEKEYLRAERSRSFMEPPPNKRGKLIATMPSIEGEMEAEARRSQSLDFSNGVIDPYLD